MKSESRKYCWYHCPAIETAGLFQVDIDVIVWSLGNHATLYPSIDLLQLFTNPFGLFLSGSAHSTCFPPKIPYVRSQIETHLYYLCFRTIKLCEDKRRKIQHSPLSLFLYSALTIAKASSFQKTTFLANSCHQAKKPLKVTHSRWVPHYTGLSAISPVPWPLLAEERASHGLI